MIRSYQGRTPIVPASCYVDPSAQILGDVVLGERSSVWMNAVIRGDVNNTGPVVPRRFLTVLCSAEPSKFEHGSGRLDLANAIADRDNPLTARVIVNRIWGQHFGRPLVATTSNFAHGMASSSDGYPTAAHRTPCAKYCAKKAGASGGTVISGLPVGVFVC